MFVYPIQMQSYFYIYSNLHLEIKKYTYNINSITEKIGNLKYKKPYKKLKENTRKKKKHETELNKNGYVAPYPA